mmetsp:Transcript_9226/g.24810  ORF Transcript_9226/g.24810 Transcript_9226/m.24810 type:complete len:117 (-) Transcript_9226:1718-2068(-)|eukprot:1160252-Pelagomonas_calceolata.AAC.22
MQTLPVICENRTEHEMHKYDIFCTFMNPSGQMTFWIGPVNLHLHVLPSPTICTWMPNHRASLNTGGIPIDQQTCSLEDIAISISVKGKNGVQDDANMQDTLPHRCCCPFAASKWSE